MIIKKFWYLLLKNIYKTVKITVKLPVHSLYYEYIIDVFSPTFKIEINNAIYCKYN